MRYFFIMMLLSLSTLLSAQEAKKFLTEGKVWKCVTSNYSPLHDEGDSVTLIVQNIDTTARRISLAPEGTDATAAVDDKAWKQHANLGRATENTGINTLAQALHKAMQNK